MFIVESDLIKLENRNDKDFEQLKRGIEILKVIGADKSVQPPHLKHVREGIYEIRSPKYRILYGYHLGNVHLLVLLKKQSSKVSTRNFRNASKRLASIK